MSSQPFKYDFTSFFCRMGKHDVHADDAVMLRRIDGSCAYCVMCERIQSDSPSVYHSLSKAVLRDINTILDHQLAMSTYQPQNFEPPKASDYEVYYGSEKDALPPAPEPVPPPKPKLWNEFSGEYEEQE